MDSKEKKRDKKLDEGNIQINLKEIKSKIYCILGFYSGIIKDDCFSLMVKTPDLFSTKILFKTKIQYYDEYDFNIYEMCFTKKIKKLSLALNNLSKEKSYDLNEIRIKLDKEKIIIMDDIMISQNFISDFRSQLGKEFIEKNIREQRNLTLFEKFNLYLNCFRSKNNDELIFLLAEQILSQLKEKDEILFCDIIKIFNITFGKELITNFLDLYPKLDIIFGTTFENEEFDKILNLYKTNKNLFFQNNLKFVKDTKVENTQNINENIENNKEISSVEKYKNLLEDIVVLYKLIYDEPNKIEKQKLINIRTIFFNLIENKKDLIKLISFLIYKFDVIYILLTLDYSKRYKPNIPKPTAARDARLLIEQFESLYEILLKEQIQKGRIILDFSEIFNYFVDNLKNYWQLVKLKNIYKTELNIIPNQYFEDKIKILIHTIGYNTMIIGENNNMEILDFLINDDIYSKKNVKDNFHKDYEILRKLDIELMDDKFFEKYERYKIYTFFEENYLKFIQMFYKINDVKYFGLFFKLLPPEKYEKETVNFILYWLKEYINTYNEEECPEFKKQIGILYSLVNSKLNRELPNLIQILVKNLKKECIELFISLINDFGETLNQKEAEEMTEYILFEQLDDDDDDDEEEEKKIKINNMYTFIETVKPNKLIVKIFLNDIENLAITPDDFFIEANINKFHLFNKLLELNDYSLLGKSDNKNYQYWLNTKRSCSIIYDNLKNLNFNYMKVKLYFNIITEKTLLKRIESVCKCLGKEDYNLSSISFFSNIKEILLSWSEKVRIIERIKNYYSFAYKRNKIIDELSKYVIKIHNSTLQYLNSKECEEEYSTYKNDLDKVQIVEELRQSKIFLNIFYDTKERYNTKDDINYAISRFYNIKKIFENDKAKIENELKNNEEVKFLINVCYENENELESNVDWLLNYFKIYTFELKSVLIDDIKSFVNKRSLFSGISGFLKLFIILEGTLDLKNQEDNSIYEQMLNHKISLSSNKEITIEEINKINNNIESNFDLNENTRKIFLKLLIAIDQFPESMKFIKDKKFEEVNNLLQFLLESDDTRLTEVDINDFINVVKLFEEIILSLKGQINVFIQFIKKIITKLNEDTKIKKSIFNYIEKYNHIQTLFNDYLKHSEGCIIKIEKILEDSTFSISKNISYTLQGSFNDQKKNNKIIGIEQNNDDEIARLMTKKYQHIFYQELESLFQRVYISKIPQKYEESADLYIKFFKNATKLINLFDEFFSKGYQEKFEVNIKFNEKIITCRYKGQIVDFNSLINDFEVLNMQLDEILNKVYSSSEIMRFFYGRQISYLFTNIVNGNKSNIIDILRASFGPIFEDCIIEKAEIDLEEKSDIRKYSEILSVIYIYIMRLFEINKKNSKNILEPNLIKIKEFSYNNDIPEDEVDQNNVNNLKNKYKGIYFYTTQKNQEIEALNLYVYMTQHFPVNGNFLYCTKDIAYEEMKCFLLRFIYCKQNVLFTMVNVDLLRNELRENFISLIKKYSLKFEGKINSCLLIIFNANDDELHKILMKTKNIKVFKETVFFSYEYNFNEFFKYKDYVVKSTSCGLGKSEFIKNKSSTEIIGKKKIKINYIYFPIGGKFTRKNLVDRLLDLPDMTNLNERFSIHFDISQTKEIKLLNEFFFKLIIFRKCDLNETAKYFGSNVDIIIEIPNDFSDYVNNIEILTKIKIENITRLSTINQSQELLNVAKILYLYETDEILKKQKSELKKINLKLTQEQINNMIMKYLSDIEIQNPNYYQINIFLKVLSDEFVKFYNCRGYMVETLLNNAIASGMGKDNAHKLLELRKFIIKSLIQVTKLFLVGPYEKLIKSQEINKKLMNEADEQKEKLIYEELKIKIDSISFDEIKPSLIVFNEDGDSCTIITTCSEQDPEFKDLERLYNSQNIDFLSSKIHSKKKKNMTKAITNYKKLTTFRNLSRNEIFDSLLSFLNVVGITEEEKNKILGTYVYTPDNFIKVVLILMRIRVGIPVILMGETGCGKTTLIEMASKLINKGKICIKKMNVHAGISDDDIIKFMKYVQDSVIAEDKRMIYAKKQEFEKMSEDNKKAYLKKNSLEKIFLEYENEIKKRKIWVFFDEINTCNSMGLFIEIMCKNTMQGKPLDDRFIYIAACNPYRVSSSENKLLNVLYKKNYKRKNLVYTVNPLPIALLNFVFNFGSLKENDEFIYIQNMIEGVTNQIFTEIKDENILKQKNDFIKKETECAQLCQNFMKKNNDASIVSLREINRFNIFVQFFFGYLMKRKKCNNDIEENYIIKLYSSKNELEILFNAVNLSLFICYYLRIPDKQSRGELCNLLNEKKYFSDGDFLNIPQMEQNYLLSNFEVPVGIAKNKNLKENIFLTFFCIINKIPVIICGKPGKSKTLSFEILQDSMKGLSSKSKFCREYPPLTAFKIQGSLNTTSEEILNIFNKGRSYQHNNSDKLAVIFMDEMGLAEIGENNPLKVIHAELEQEQEQDKIAFVGISNWFIDASKMNRVIYNVAQDADEDDLIQTGKEIARSYEKIEENFNSQKYDNLIIRLSKAYYKFISNKKETNDKNRFFHGSRDFYNLIKLIMHDIIKNTKTLDDYSLNGNIEKSEELLNEICINQIYRNFGGLENSVYEFKSYYLEGYEEINFTKNYDFKKCIQDNINDFESRYLLLINDGNLCQELLNYILEEINENRKINTTNYDKNKEKGIELFDGETTEKKEVYVKYYIGSNFKADKNNVIYSNEILNKIRLQMETENILILKDLESVYPALYELFNQNYIYLNGKKFVHLGESKSLSLVNNKFKVIVLVEKDQIENQEPPFLNRFEKHIINFSNLLNKELQEISKEIYNTLKEISNFEICESNVKIENIENRFKKYNNIIKEEEIQGLVYIGAKQLNFSSTKNEETQNTNKILLIKFVLERIVPCFPEELMILITKFGFKKKYNSYYKLLYQCYKEKYCYNFNDYLLNSTQDISIIYTFSSIFDEITITNSEYSQHNIVEIYMSNIISIEQINKEITDFIFEDLNTEINSHKYLMIMKFREEDMNKLNNIYYLIDDYISNSRNKNLMKYSKKIVFIIYIKKINKIKNYMSFLSNCPQIMINNLNNQYSNFPEILVDSNKDIIEKKLFDIETMITDNIDNVLRYFNYKLYNTKESQANAYKKLLAKCLTNSKYLRNIIIESLANLANNEEDFLAKICKENITFKDNNGLIENNNFSFLLDKQISVFIFQNFRIIIIILEKEQIINAVLFNERLCEIDLIKNYIKEFISHINNEENKKYNWKNKNLNQKVNINILYEQKFPFCQKIFNNLFSFVQNNIAMKFLEKDTYFITTSIKDQNIKKEVEDYFKYMQKFDDNLKFEIFKDKKNKIVLDILNSNSEELISNFFEECFFTFIKKNDKFKTHYTNLAQILNLLLQLRLKTRINNELNLFFLDKDKIELNSSFIDLIKEEWISDKNEEKEETIYINEMQVNKNSKYFNIFISVVNFLQSYSKEINIILELYYFLLEDIPTIYDEVITMIHYKKISMEESKRNSYYNKVNKFCFFYIMESLCAILKEKIYEVLMDKKVFTGKLDYFKSVKYLVQNILQLEKRFLLFSKEIFSLDIIMKIISQIQLKNNNLSFVYLSIESLSIFLSKFDRKELIQNLQGQNMMLIKIFGNNIDEYSQLMNKILLNYYKGEYDNNLREKIIKEIVLEDKLKYHYELMEYIYPLLKVIFKFNSLELPYKKEHLVRFMENFNDKNSIKKCINNKNDIKINEVLFYRFEILCMKYFNNILNKNKDDYQKLCGELSKKYLKDAIECYYKPNGQINIYLNNIYKLYCIAYIKIYLYYYVNIIYENKYQEFPDREDVNMILFWMINKQKHVVKYYTLKLIAKKFQDWKKFVEYYNSISTEKNDLYGFNKYEIILKFEQNENFIKPPFLLHCNKIRENKEYIEFLAKIQLEGFNKSLFENMFLKPKKFNYLYIFLANHTILYYLHSNKDELAEKKNILLELIKIIINYLNSEKKLIDKDILSFINTFFDIKNLEEKIFQKIGFNPKENNENQLSKIQILYYSLLFVISIILSPKSKSKSSNNDLLYQNLISKNISSFLETNYLPGNFQFNNLKIKSFYEIKDTLKKEPRKIGVYMCSCGYYYTIPRCTFPSQERKCLVCHQLIGGKKGSFVQRKGHLRIFLNEETRSEKKNKLKAKKIPTILLDELEKEINEAKNDMIIGIKTNNIGIDEFLFKDEKVREMKDITYRFLNFVLYSFIFYGNIAGFIKDKNMNIYNIGNLNCFNILEKDWEIMQNILDKIPVELFINLIFDDIIEKLIACPKFQKKEEAIIFEKEINDIIQNKIKEQNLLNYFKQINDDAINLNPLSDKSIIQEVFSHDKYSEKDFPDFKYFYIFEYPTKEHFIKIFNSKDKNKDKYPILNNIINNDEIRVKLELMKYLPKINKLCNYMINFVSFKYSRDEAKSKLVKDEIKDEEFISLLRDFIPIYKKIRPYIKQEGCHEFGLQFEEINEDTVLLNELCVDSGEMGYGLVLLAMYKDMAGWQNSFINEVLNSENIQLKNYKDLFNSKIMIQDCETEQILDLPYFESQIILRNDKNATLLEMITDNSIRKGGEVFYNLDEIEDELAAFILPRIKAFKQDIRKVVYQYECLIGDRSSLIINFIDKYQQRELTEIELNAVVCYILKNENNPKFDMKNFLFSLQVLIDIILDESPNMNETLISILETKNNLPFIDLDKNFFKEVLENIKQFETFEENNQRNSNNNITNNYFTINCLINLIEIVELFCWKNIRNNLDKKYFDDINNQIKKQFDNLLSLNQDDPNNTFMITKLELCSAIRKFLSRSLAGKSDENINPKNLLKSYITNAEFWPINFADMDIETEINMIFGKIDVYISQSVKLFDYLGGDGQKLEEIKDKYDKYAERYKKSKELTTKENHDFDGENNFLEIIGYENKENVKESNLSNIREEYINSIDNNEIKKEKDVETVDDDDDSQNSNISY